MFDCFRRRLNRSIATLFAEPWYQNRKGKCKRYKQTDGQANDTGH